MLADFQNALVRMVVDSDFRTLFLADAQKTLAEFSLSPSEIKALLSIPLEQLTRFADSLLAKRRMEFSHTIPLSLRIAPSLAIRYEKWLANHPALHTQRILPPGAAEALRALPILRAALLADHKEASYAADLLTFEVLSHCSASDGVVRFMRARYRVDLLANEIRRGIIPIDPDESPTLFHFEKAKLYWRSID